MARFKRYLTGSGWTALSSHSYKAVALQQSISADFVVLGAGLAGLAAARQIAQLRPDATVVVLDADQPLQNSSARNSGFMIALPYTKIDNRQSEDEAAWQIRLMRSGEECLRSICDQSGKSCGWSRSGHYKAATTAAGARALQQTQALLQAKNVDFRALSASDIQAELGTSAYRAALWMPDCTLVQPAELMAVILSSLPANVSVYFNSEVSRFHKTAGGYSLEVNGLQVNAGRLAVCVNTHAPDLGIAASRQLPMYTYACITRAFDLKQMDLGRDAQWGVTPVERLEATSRKLPGNRLMLRAGFSYKHEWSVDQQRAYLLDAIQRRYPDIHADDLETSWGGAVSLTRNGAPFLRKLSNNAVAVSGCNGSGLLKMTALGALAAHWLLGHDTALLQETLRFSRPSYIPPEPFRAWGVAQNIRKLRRELTEEK